MATSTRLNKRKLRDTPEIDRSDTLPGEELLKWLDSDDDEAPADPAPAPTRQATAKPAAAPDVHLPHEPVLRRLLGGEHKSQFLLLADWFEGAISKRPADVCVETDFGDVHFEVIDWIDTPGFLKVVVDSERMPFRPKSMVKMRIRRRDEVFLTTCVSPLSPMFGPLPFAEMLFVVDGKEPAIATNIMEKNARVTKGDTPSAVSGLPSTDVDNEEPVADGEKAASLRAVVLPKDFDVSRDYGDG